MAADVEEPERERHCRGPSGRVMRPYRLVEQPIHDAAAERARSERRRRAYRLRRNRGGEAAPGPAQRVIERAPEPELAGALDELGPERGIAAEMPEQQVEVV